MKKIIVLGLILLLTGGMLFAVDVKLDFPSNPFVNFNNALGEFQKDANEILGKFEQMNDLVNGMANASSFAADGATMRNFIGYKKFSVAIGTMVGVQAPSYNFLDAVDNIDDANDIYAGINAQVVTVSAGVNLGFLVEGLYASAKFGKFSMSIEDFDINMYSFGLFAQYQLIESKTILMASWKGVQVGTGFVYYSGDVSYKTDVGTIETDVTLAGGTGKLAFDPDLEIKLATSGLKIPIEIMTGVRVAVVDISFGLGVDINVRSNVDLTFDVEGPAHITPDAGGSRIDGTASVGGGTEGGRANIFSPKLMTGVGFSLGPVKLDIPITYYFGTKGPGANIGLTGAFVL